MKAVGPIAALLFLLWQADLTWTQEAGPLRFRLLPQESEIVTEVGAPFGQIVVGKFTLLEGLAQGRTADLKTSSSVKLAIKASSYDSSLGIRDVDVRENYLEVQDYPLISFASTAIKEVRSPTSPSGLRRLTIQGELSLHGVKRNIELPITMTYNKEKIVVEGNMTIQFQDYHIRTPTVFFFRADDRAKVSFRIVGALQP